MKSGQHGIPNHSIRPTVLMARRQGRKVGWVLLMHKSKKLLKNMKGLMEVKLTKIGATEQSRRRIRRNEWDYLMNPRWYFGDKKPRKWAMTKSSEHGFC